MKKLIAEFSKDIILQDFDKKIDELVSTFPVGVSIMIRVETLKDKSIATLWPNPDTKAIERKVWEIK